MNPLLEIRPSACLFLLGPQLTRTFPSRLDYNSVLTSAVAKLRTTSPDAEVKKFEKDISKMGALEVMQETLSRLRTKGSYKEWLEETFSKKELSGIELPDSVRWLIELQQMGAMVACTDYDTLLDDVCGLQPATISSEDPAFNAWLTCSDTGVRTISRPNKTAGKDKKEEGGKRSSSVAQEVGFLHLHGVRSSSPGSVSLLPYAEGAERNGGDRNCRTDLNAGRSFLNANTLASLQTVFHDKLVFLVGFDGEEKDPLLPSLLQLLYPETDSKLLKNPPILLSTSHSSSLFQEFLQLLQLKISSVDKLREIILPGSAKNFSVGKEHTDKHSDGIKVQAFLLFNEKQSFRKLGEIIYQQSKSGEIYVRRDALTVIFDNNSILYGNLVTYGGNGLKKLWDLVFSDSSTLLGKGLVAVGLQSAAIIWINNKPEGLGNITGINSVHTYAAHQAVHNMAMSQKTLPSSSPSSLTTPTQPRPPPYFTPVSRIPPFHSPPSSGVGVARDSPSPSSNTSAKGSESAEVVTASVTSNGVGGAPMTSAVTSLPMSVPVPLAVNPFPCMVLPGLGGGAGGVVTPGGVVLAPHLYAPQTIATVPLANQLAASRIIPTSLLPSAPRQLAVPSGQLAVAPGQLAVGRAGQVIAQAPAAVPLLASPSVNPSLPPFMVSQTDLEVLTQIQSRISNHLSSMSSDEETSSDPNRTGAELGEVRLCSPGTVKLCVATPAEVLRQTGPYETSIRRILKQAECIIERYENTHYLGSTSGSMGTRNSRGVANTGVVVTASLSTSATTLKYTTTAPQLSLNRGHAHAQSVSTSSDSNGRPDVHLTPLKTAAVSTVATVAAVPPPPALTISSPPPLISHSSYQYPSFLPLLYTPLVAPLAGIPAPQRPALAPPGYYIVPGPLATPTSESVRAGAPIPIVITANPHAITTGVQNGTVLPPPGHVARAGVVPPLVSTSLSSAAARGAPSVSTTPPPLRSSNKATPTPIPPALSVVVSPKTGARVSKRIGTKLETGTKVITTTTADGNGTETTRSHTIVLVNRKRPIGSAYSTNSKILKVSDSSQDLSPLHPKTSARASRGSTPRASGGSTPRASGGSTPRASGGSTPRASGGSTPRASGGSTPRASGGSTPRTSDRDRSVSPKEDVESTTSEGQEQGSVSTESERLWQFLLDLLLTPNHGTMIQWTGKENEFNIVDTPTIADLWTKHCGGREQRGEGKGATGLEKFSRSLEACCLQGLLECVQSKDGTFKFLINIQKYIIEHIPLS